MVNGSAKIASESDAPTDIGKTGHVKVRKCKVEHSSLWTNININMWYTTLKVNVWLSSTLHGNVTALWRIQITRSDSAQQTSCIVLDRSRIGWCECSYDWNHSIILFSVMTSHCVFSFTTTTTTTKLQVSNFLLFPAFHDNSLSLSSHKPKTKNTKSMHVEMFQQC